MNERNVMEVLGKNMHDIRFRKNISIQELSKKVGIDVETLIKFEAAESTVLSIGQYIMIANALKVSFEEMTKGIVFEED